MEYRRLGHSGLLISAIGLGTNAFGKRSSKEDSISIIHKALDHGINFIDTANIYAGSQSEKIIGKALKNRRSEAILTTKAGLPTSTSPYDRGASRLHLVSELEKSLKRLQTDYIDLFQIHTFDPYTPLEETLRTLDTMVESGKVRYIGCSNYYAWEMMKSLAISEKLNLTSYISHQVSYSLLDRTPERELIPFAVDQGIGIITYFPLAGGILTGKYTSKTDGPEGSRIKTDANFARFLSADRLAFAKKLVKLSKQAKTTPEVLAMSWLLKKQQVTSVIAGATSAEQLDSHIAASQFIMDDALFEQLESLSAPYIYGEPFATYRI